jgi:hypothetical protein
MDHHIDVNKQAEINNEEESENAAVINDNLNQLSNQIFFQCRSCPFRSESNGGLSPHIARKHYQEQGQENFNLINL